MANTRDVKLLEIWKESDKGYIFPYDRTMEIASRFKKRST